MPFPLRSSSSSPGAAPPPPPPSPSLGSLTILFLDRSSLLRAAMAHPPDPSPASEAALRPQEDRLSEARVAERGHRRPLGSGAERSSLPERERDRRRGRGEPLNRS